jgi:hypothetical protein
MDRAQRDRTRVPAWVCLLFSSVLAALAVLLIIVSFRLPFSTIQARLVQIYGAQRVDVYFTPAAFVSAMSRLRLGACVLLFAALLVGGFRVRLARALDSIWGALVLGIRHARRTALGFDPARSIALGFIILIGLLIRLQFIQQPMRYDESETVVSYATKPVYLGLSIYTEPNNHIFHTLMVHFAILLAGTAEWAVRLPAFIAGMLLCPLAYLLARRLGGNTAALWAAALIATSSILVEFSTNARGYTLLCCATLVLLIAAHDSLRRASPAAFALFGIAAVIGFWTIPIFLMPFGGTLLWMVWESLRRHRYFQRVYWIRLSVTTVIAGVATLLVYLPPVAANGPSALLRNQWTAPHSFHVFLTGNLERFHDAWQMWNRDLPVWWPWAIGFAFLLSLTLRTSVRRLVISLVVWTTLLFVVQRYLPYPRNWLVFLPIFLIAAATAIAWMEERAIPLKRRNLVAASTAVILAALLAVPVVRNQTVLASPETGTLRSASQIDTFLVTSNIPTDRVFRTAIASLPLDYYWWRRTGVHPRFANVQDLKQRDIHDGWFLLNIGEHLDTFPISYKFENIRVLEVRQFPGADLYHVSWTR